MTCSNISAKGMIKRQLYNFHRGVNVFELLFKPRLLLFLLILLK